MVKRTIVGLLLALGFLALLYFGGIAQNILCAFASVLCVYEMLKALKAKGLNPYQPPIYLFSVAAHFIQIAFDKYWLGFFAIACILWTIIHRIKSEKNTTTDMFAGLGVYLYPIVPFLFLMYTCNMKDFGTSRVAMLMLFAAPLLCDTFAYFIGSFFGRKKLCPHISPKKTVIGCLGGLLGGMAGGLLVYYTQMNLYLIWRVPQSEIITIPLIPMLVCGLLLAFMGQVGDLFASTIKRWVGIKDFGSIFPGHGGMLDRLDSVLFCAPLVYVIFINFGIWFGA